ncbi:MAG: pro-sigmaK processing inhibitor BofA [Clostridiales bacterium]|nr:pro-sigmaK processing inhibitor BofA [Clostridiales bacterium]
MPEITLSAIGIYVGAMVLLYMLGKALAMPLKVLGRLLISAFFGGVMLLLLNLFGANMGIDVGVNPLTAFLAGFFGIPGVGLLVLLQYIILF